MPRVRYLTDPFDRASEHAASAAHWTASALDLLTSPASRPAYRESAARTARAHARAAARCFSLVEATADRDGRIVIPSVLDRPAVDLHPNR